MSRPKDADKTPDAEGEGPDRRPEAAEEAGRPAGDKGAPEPDERSARIEDAAADEGTGDEARPMADDPALTDEWRSGEDAEPRRSGEEGTAEDATRPDALSPEDPAERIEDAEEVLEEERAAREEERPQARREAAELAEEQDEHEEHGSGVAARLLAVLVVALVAAGAALWGAPKLAPHVPQGVARYLTPGQAEAQDRIDALATRLSELEGALADRPSADALSGVAEAVSNLDGTVSALEERVAALEEAPAPADAPTDAPAEAPAAQPVAGVAPEEVEALSARLDAVAAIAETGAALAPEIEAIRARLDALAERVDAVEGAREGEIDRLEQAVRSSALDRALEDLTSAARAGAPFAEALAEVEAISGQTAPEPVATAADGSVPSSGELLRGMAEPARAALAADIKAGAGEGMLGQAGAWLRSQIVARPTEAREGDDVASILSRVGASLEAGDPMAAKAEADALPGHASEAMAGWLDRLAARAALDAALSEWTRALGARG